MEQRGLLKRPPSQTEQQEAKEREQRKQQASRSLLEFARLYLPHYLFCQPCELHEYLAGLFLESISSPYESRVAIAAPRGEAKTTWISKIAPLWCICFPNVADKWFILLLSDTTRQAKGNLLAIRHELEHNERIRRDFGDLVGEEKWTEEAITTSNGIRIEAYGAGKSLRGATSEQNRPDLIICDDLENQKNVNTPYQRDKLEEWLKDTAFKTPGPKGADIFIVGTVLHPASVLARFLANGAYETRLFQAMLSWPTRMDLWDRWRLLYTDKAFSEKERKANAQAFYEENKEQMEEGAQVLWPAGDPLYRLMEFLARDGLASFNKEKQNTPKNPEECFFDDNTFHYWRHPDELGQPGDRLLPELRYTIASVDPSMGKKAKKNDFSAIVVLGRGLDGRDYVLEANLKKRPPSQIIADVIELYKRYRFRECVVEAIAFQEFLAQTMEEAARAEDLHLPIYPVRYQPDKIMRIQGLEPAIRNGHIVFNRRHRLLMEQLELFPTADHDDGPDALEMAYSRGQTFFASASVPEGEYRPSNVPQRGATQQIGSIPRRGALPSRAGRGSFRRR